MSAQKAFKMRLGADQILPRIFQHFLEFILFSLELNLFIMRLSIPFRGLQEFFFIWFIVSQTIFEPSYTPHETLWVLQFGHHQIFS
jgi:hypothetical protein